MIFGIGHCSQPPTSSYTKNTSTHHHRQQQQRQMGWTETPEVNTENNMHTKRVQANISLNDHLRKKTTTEKCMAECCKSKSTLKSFQNPNAPIEWRENDI